MNPDNSLLKKKKFCVEPINKILKKKQFYHFSKNIIDNIGTNSQIYCNDLDFTDKKTSMNKLFWTFFHKSKEIWYSENSHWLDFMRNEFESKEIEYNCIYELVPNYKNILQIKTQDDINEFQKKYEITNTKKYIKYFFNQCGISFKGQNINFNIDKIDFSKELKEKYGNINSEKIIDWFRVAQDYDGIEFIPFLGCGINSSFYYCMLDIPSGCIFKKEGLKMFKLKSIAIPNINSELYVKNWLISDQSKIKNKNKNKKRK